MRDDSRKNTQKVWARKHNEVMIRIHALLEHEIQDALNQWELRIQDRTDESHVRYIQTVHDRLATLVAALAEDTVKA